MPVHCPKEDDPPASIISAVPSNTYAVLYLNSSIKAMSGAEGRSAELPFLRSWLLQISLVVPENRLVELGSAPRTEVTE